MEGKYIERWQKFPLNRQVYQLEIFSCEQQGPVLTNANQTSFTTTILGAQRIVS